MAITSKMGRTTKAEECLIRHWQDAGLLKPAAIKPVIATIEQSLVLRKLGRLSRGDLLEMENVLRHLLGLT